MSRALTIAELITEFGSHLGSHSRCSCCNKLTMYAIRYPDRDTLFVCAYCDTEKRGV